MAVPLCAIAAPALELARTPPDRSAPASVKPEPFTDPLLSSTPQAAASDVELIDLGEAGSLVRLVEQGARNPVTLKLPVQRPERSERKSAALAASAPAESSAQAAAAVESVRENAGTGGDLAETRSDPNPVFVSGSPAAYPGGERNGSGAGAGGGLSDFATREQRNVVKDAVALLRSFFNHPATWLAIAVVVGISVVTSVGRGRGK